MWSLPCFAAIVRAYLPPPTCCKPQPRQLSTAVDERHIASVRPTRLRAMSEHLRVASVNVNGIRAAFRKGMGDWLDQRNVDVLAMQEVRAQDEHLLELLGDEWHILHDPCVIKGRAGVAIASRVAPTAHRIGLGAEDRQDLI